MHTLQPVWGEGNSRAHSFLRPRCRSRSTRGSPSRTFSTKCAEMSAAGGLGPYVFHQVSGKKIHDAGTVAQTLAPPESSKPRAPSEQAQHRPGVRSCRMRWLPCDWVSRNQGGGRNLGSTAIQAPWLSRHAAGPFPFPRTGPSGAGYTRTGSPIGLRPVSADLTPSR
jgi:hypothetical protein